MVELDGASLTIDSLAAVAERRDEVILAPAARDRMAAAREVVEEALKLNLPVYGLTTALAERKSVRLDSAARQGFSRFLIRGHLIAQGPPAPPPVVRAEIGLAHRAEAANGRHGIPVQRAHQDVG